MKYLILLLILPACASSAAPDGARAGQTDLDAKAPLLSGKVNKEDHAEPPPSAAQQSADADAPPTAEVHPAPPPPPGYNGPPALVGFPTRVDAPKHRHWLHNETNTAQSFIAEAKYSQREYISDSAYLSKCRAVCWNNPRCLGFFEQTHLCPQPGANDHRSNPNHDEGRGCYRICGFYDQGESPLSLAMVQGPSGSVWFKEDAFGKGGDAGLFFGMPPMRAPAP